MWGDTHINGVSMQANPTAPQALQSTLQSMLGPRYQVTVINDGVRRANACWRIDGLGVYSKKLADDLVRSPAQVVIENFGINDSNAAVAPETPDQYLACLGAFIDIVRAAGKTPVLEEPNPVDGVSYAEALTDYVEMIHVAAKSKGVTVIEQYGYIKSMPNWPALLSDGVHPSQALYYLKAQREADYLAPMLRSMLPD